jgi:hypothetical protein
MSGRRMPMVQVSFFVGIPSIYLCMAFEDPVPLMSTMTMAFIVLFCVLKVEKSTKTQF